MSIRYCLTVTHVTQKDPKLKCGSPKDLESFTRYQKLKLLKFFLGNGEFLSPEKCPYSEFFWSVFSHIRSISPYSIRMRENTGQKISNTNTFHAVEIYTYHHLKLHHVLTYIKLDTIITHDIREKIMLYCFTSKSYN